MKRRFSYLPLLAIVCLTLTLHGQELFVPREIDKAYENGTRSRTGAPGEKYWHNTADYRMVVNVDPAEWTLEGESVIAYYNNSPDELGQVVLRLFGNVYRKGAGRDYPVDPEEVTDGVVISRLEVDGVEIDLASWRQARFRGTNVYVTLPEALGSGETTQIRVNWAQAIGPTDGRQGYIDSTSAMVAYWYPQVAVYDDIFGWDNLQYGLQAEFYNNLADFDVTINVPAEFTVLATGALQNVSDVLPAENMEAYENAMAGDETVGVVTTEELAEGFAYRSGSWHYVAEEVSDFAFCLSDHYAWDAASQEVDGRRVLINALFPAEEAESYVEVVQMHRQIMEVLSDDFPGVPYPYPAYTAFMGMRGGGMEFPMMANNDGPGLRVSIHEMFHTYFPMYVRTNERRFAWMDEGWADYVDAYIAKVHFADDETTLGGEFSARVQGSVGSFSELPLITSTQFMDGSNYGYASYPLPGMVVWLLHEHLGNEVFTKCLQTFIHEWAKKSPTPYDFFNTFNRVSGQDLNWFWQPWFFEFGYPEVAVASGKGSKVIIEKRGIKPVPLTADITYNDGTTEQIAMGMEIWQDKDSYKLKIPRSKEVSYLLINKQLPDYSINNNFYPSLSAIYAGRDLSAITGKYFLQQFNLEVILEEQGGALHIVVPRQGSDDILLPVSEGMFETLDGVYEIEGKEDGGLIIRTSFGNEWELARVE